MQKLMIIVFMHKVELSDTRPSYGKPVDYILEGFLVKSKKHCSIFFVSRTFLAFAMIGSGWGVGISERPWERGCVRPISKLSVNFADLAQILAIN